MWNSGWIREAASTVLGRAVEPFAGPRELWRKHNSRVRSILPVQSVVSVIDRRWPGSNPAPQTRPIFIFSAGWRSGSTLLQRILVSGGDVLVWGEPYTYADYIGKLAESLRMFSEVFPPQEFFLRHHEGTSVSAIQEKWIAHLYPDPEALKEAHRAFFSKLLGDPAAARGYRRWGLKECKYGIEHARYLKWLFPDAKFFFVYRNPFHAYRSFRLFGAYTRWPDRPVFTPRAFGNLWKTLLEGYVAHHQEMDGMLVKYEDLAAGKIPAATLGAFAGVRCDPDVIEENITGRGKRNLVPVPAFETRLLERAVAPLAVTMGYAPSR